MRKFWTFLDNGTYRVGCNGGTLYIYDQNNRELAKFKDLRYAYTGAFHPSKNIFALKSTEGALAFYDLDRMCLLKKIVYTRLGAQDEGFAFTPDGRYFLNIEKPVLSYRTELTIYDTETLEVVKRMFRGEETIVLENLEFSKSSPDCFVLGFLRGEDGVFAVRFIAKLQADCLTDLCMLPEDLYDYTIWYKRWERSGHTEKELEWSHPVVLKTSERPHVTLEGIWKTLR